MFSSISRARKFASTGWKRERPIRAGLIPTLVAAASGWQAGSVLAAFPQLKLEPVSVGELSTPIGMATANDGSNRLFITDQRGRIQIIQNGSLLPTPFLDLGPKLVPQRTSGGNLSFDERGLLGLAFHPDYSKPGAPGEGKFYAFYSAISPNAPGPSTNPVNCRSVISEFRVMPGNPNLADPGYERVLLSFDKPQFNHNGGQLAFGPDRLLYLSTGDGGGSNDNDPGHTGGASNKPANALGNSQDRTNLMGKILRIDPLGSNAPGGQYGIPADNPFVGAGGGIREEIYAYGLRNPWRFSFDDGPGGTNRLFVADVGQNFYEEINIVEKGGNYGWRNREGFHSFAPSAPGTGPFLDPIAEYSHPNAPDGVKIGLSTTGGFVYRGSAIPALKGKYVFGDWSTDFAAANGHILGLEETGSGWTLSILDVEGGNPIKYFINSFGEDEHGELYVLANLLNRPDPAFNGVIFKIVPEPATLCGLLALGAGACFRRSRRRGA
ncbi:MAG: PQQ-dependent sugar dehydrogenase [Phycisphaerae bacterium]|jgi:glucose/arabinose dehydrogenase